MIHRICDHQISLRFRFADEADSPSVRDEKAILDAVRSIFGWVYFDAWGVEVERFTIYSPDWDGADPEDGTDLDSVWVLTFGSTSEIPLAPEDCTEEKSIDAQTMVTRIRERLAEMFPKLIYVRSTEWKKFEYSTNSNLQF